MPIENTFRCNLGAFPFSASLPLNECLWFTFMFLVCLHVGGGGGEFLVDIQGNAFWKVIMLSCEYQGAMHCFCRGKQISNGNRVRLDICLSGNFVNICTRTRVSKTQVPFEWHSL